MTDTPVAYTSWADVPPGLMTRTVLGQLDLPRTPGGPPRGVVATRNFRGRDTEVDLYAVAESVPTGASMAQLLAARTRTGAPDTRRCTDCGARPERPCTPHEDGVVLCGCCGHIRHLRTAQRQAAGQRAGACERAAQLLADERLAVVHVQLTERGTTPGGTRRPPSAARVVALGPQGQPLCDVTMRLVGPRAAGIPDGACSPEDAAPLLQVLADRVLLEWEGGALAPVSSALRAAGLPGPFPTGYGARRALWALALTWRADISPRSRSLRPVISPGRADRMLWLLQQIAADHQPTRSS
ncbi:hypothetical protein [Streptomyces corynorhini]|uniref:Uncharacterized protein n=1 Tax=Streptomyces corynorhini TaxID=2282652 RepID=A0A370B004_9ACTN|nr:hypothetical protein [Streptomyces corynorhini]RDG35178.1 hypothetical protein DVH02_26640 [Streptomyces corynorhini]